MMALFLLLVFSVGIGAIGVGVGYGYGCQTGDSTLAIRRAVLESLTVSCPLPGDCIIESIRLGDYQILTDPVAIEAFNDGRAQAISGRWVERHGLRIDVRVRRYSGAFLLCSSSAEKKTALPKL